MASSRFDNIRYYDGSFKIPHQIQVYDGNGFVDLGTKDSYNTKKVSVLDNNKFNCVTYWRHDVNIPKSILLGSGNRYMDLYRDDSASLLQVNTKDAGYSFTMQVEIFSSTTLWTSFDKNNGDITSSAFNSYYADVSGNKVRFRIRHYFRGYSYSGSFIRGSIQDACTDYVWTVGERVTIVVTKASTSGTTNVKIYNPAGTLLTDRSFSIACINVAYAGPKIHSVGRCVYDAYGNTEAYGESKLYNLSFTPRRSGNFTFSADQQGNGATQIWSIGVWGHADLRNTSVYGASYAEYLRQTI